MSDERLRELELRLRKTGAPSDLIETAAAQKRTRTPNWSQDVLIAAEEQRQFHCPAHAIAKGLAITDVTDLCAPQYRTFVNVQDTPYARITLIPRASQSLFPFFTLLDELAGHGLVEIGRRERPPGTLSVIDGCNIQADCVYRLLELPKHGLAHALQDEEFCDNWVSEYAGRRHLKRTSEEARRMWENHLPPRTGARLAQFPRPTATLPETAGAYHYSRGDQRFTFEHLPKPLDNKVPLQRYLPVMNAPWTEIIE